MSAYTELASQVQILKERGWTEKHGFWSHPKYYFRPFISRDEHVQIYLFTFEQVVKKEGIQ